jgi:uncharacterized membrane protein
MSWELHMFWEALQDHFARTLYACSADSYLLICLSTSRLDDSYFQVEEASRYYPYPT